LLLLTVSFAGCRLTSIHAEIGGSVIALLTLFAMISPLPIYWHENGRTALRESVLVIPWEMLVAVTLPFAVFVAARLRMPLQDTLLGNIDQALGVSVPAIMAWADHHWLGTVINATYPTLLPLLAVACLAPQLTGRVKEARIFLLANLIAYAIGLPLFAMLPAIGPWSFYHLVPPPNQAITADLLLELRLPGPYYSHGQGAGLVCFPSFHVVWAILCAAALWGFRPLRIPVAVLTVLIILSTMTTGWHYFCDVLAGLVIAVISLAIARIYAH
jgi:membrane-associated phospholipid phosphatase